MSIKFEGMDGFLDRIKSRPEKLRKVLPAVFFQEAEEIMTEAKQETPVDRGLLRASGFAALPVEENGKVSVTMGFGGVAGSGNLGETNEGDVGYAVYVHENLDSNHIVGNAKFLENPLNRHKVDMSERLAESIDQKMEK